MSSLIKNIAEPSLTTLLGRISDEIRQTLFDNWGFEEAPEEYDQLLDLIKAQCDELGIEPSIHNRTTILEAIVEDAIEIETAEYLEGLFNEISTMIKKAQAHAELSPELISLLSDALIKISSAIDEKEQEREEKFSVASSISIDAASDKSSDDSAEDEVVSLPPGLPTPIKTPEEFLKYDKKINFLSQAVLRELILEWSAPGFNPERTPCLMILMKKEAEKLALNLETVAIDTIFKIFQLTLKHSDLRLAPQFYQAISFLNDDLPSGMEESLKHITLILHTHISECLKGTLPSNLGTSFLSILQYIDEEKEAADITQDLAFREKLTQAKSLQTLLTEVSTSINDKILSERKSIVLSKLTPRELKIMAENIHNDFRKDLQPVTTESVAYQALVELKGQIPARAFVDRFEPFQLNYSQGETDADHPVRLKIEEEKLEKISGKNLHPRIPKPQSAFALRHAKLFEDSLSLSATEEEGRQQSP
jgi:hypothetical protein